jgi:hypothetical protein
MSPNTEITQQPQAQEMLGNQTPQQDKVVAFQPVRALNNLTRIRILRSLASNSFLFLLFFHGKADFIPCNQKAINIMEANPEVSMRGGGVVGDWYVFVLFLIYFYPIILLLFPGSSPFS